MTSTGSNGQTALQHWKNTLSREKEPEKEKEKPEGGTRPTYLPESSGRTPSCSNNKEVFRCFTCAACPPTHSRPLSVCVLSAATPQQRWAALLPHRGSRILHIMWRLTHFVNVSAWVWAAACVCMWVIWLRVPCWCGQSGYFGSQIETTQCKRVKNKWRTL